LAGFEFTPRSLLAPVDVCDRDSRCSFCLRLFNLRWMGIFRLVFLMDSASSLCCVAYPFVNNIDLPFIVLDDGMVSR